MIRPAAIAVLAAVAAAGCTLPGQPRGVSLEGQPAKVEDFDTLFGANCAGCHGDHGRGGAALPLDNPVYLAIADDETLRRIIAGGVADSAMPPFATRSGGMLTDRQVDVLVRGLRAHAAPLAGAAATPPPYVGPTGDPQRGSGLFAPSCARCHGADGKGGPKSGSIVDGSYLALVSPQSLRTLLIAGRPDIGQPDWRGDVPGRPLTSQEIADLVAWLVAQRSAYPGRPYPASP